MADVNKILKPRRGTSTIMSGTKANTVLADGEMFIELPATGTAGGGKCKMKIGDGTTVYSQLGYAMGDPSTDPITITADTSSTADAAIANVTTGATLGTILGALKQAITKAKEAIPALATAYENSSTKAAAASTVYSLNSNLTANNIKFYYDYKDGQYGYNTSSSRGADTFHPFKSGPYCDDEISVTLSGSHSGTYTFKVCYVSETTVCLLSKNSVGTNQNWSVQCAYSWNWQLILDGKIYNQNSNGCEVAKIPTHPQIYSNCSNFIRDFTYWTSTPYPKNESRLAIYVNNEGRIPNTTYSSSTQQSNAYGCAPFITVII